MPELPTILVTGANGQLGKALQRLAGVYPQYNFVFAGREDLPIHHFEMLRHYFSVYHPVYVVNCAAYTAVDRAETEKDLAFQVNAEAVGVLAAVCHEQGAKLVHISTDYVFDGNAKTPYKEDDPTHPQSVYGASKLEGEKQAFRFNPDSIVIRTSWVYAENGKNFVRTMLKLMSEKPEINVVNDQYGSPTYAGDLAAAVMQVIASGKWVPGIYHYSNEGVVSWYDFAIAIRDRAGLTCKVNSVPSSQYPTPAKRPAWSVLDSSRIGHTWGIRPRPWFESLETCLSHLL